MNPYQNPSGEELPTGNVPQAVQPLQKRGRGLEESMLIDNEPVTKETEGRCADCRGGGGVRVAPAGSRGRVQIGSAPSSPKAGVDGRNTGVGDRVSIVQQQDRVVGVALEVAPEVRVPAKVASQGVVVPTKSSLVSVAILDHLAATPPPLSHLGEDVPGWRWDDKREFRVSSAYTVLMQAGERVRSSKWSRIWSLKVPQRVKVFLWITAHQRHLTNVERLRRHIASSDMCGLCLSGPEDIDHILRHCVNASGLWRSVLGQEVADSLSSLSFEEWLHGNISGRLPAIISRKDWGMEFAIYCWLLWKLRCSMVLDPSFVERESVWERGRRLLVECQAVFAAAVRDPAALSISAKRWIGPQRGWIKGNVDAAVSIGDGRSCNGVADKLAKHGQKASLQGLLFAVPPGPVALVVVAEQQYWEAGKSFDNPRV
ncbi:hypothetical protein V6N11_009566 [Hibiscus sabdariffa]|uniref:Reverse transcriptase zinc-binding domain-containing protein n=1 Tax=Hibiscus sabdariffa TaxID=183260 RepID=A0ABR2P5R0_9ROSI